MALELIVAGIFYVIHCRMTFTFDIELPPNVERALRSETRPVEQLAREALAVALFREGRLTHYELSCAITLNRTETDAVLKRYQVPNTSLTFAESGAERAALEEVLGPVAAESTTPTARRD